MSTVSNSVKQCQQCQTVSTVSTLSTVSTVSTVIARCFLHLRWYFFNNDDDNNSNNVDKSRQDVKLYLKCAPFLTRFLFSSEQTFLQERSTRMMGMDEER